MSETLYIVDSFSLMFQVFYAIRQPMTGANGQPTNAAFGFNRDLRYLRDQMKPTHLICAIESDEPGKRSEIYEEYKANRSEMPDDLRQQIPLIIELIEGYNIPLINSPGWEADDVIATVAKQAEARGMTVRIVTGDKDLRQLLSKKIGIYNLRKKAVFDVAALDKEWGIRPDQVIDFQALVGDSVDNVPGVPLVGPKKAGALLEEFGTLEEVLANADKAPGKKLKENLNTYADQALMSRELVTLQTDLELDVDWDAAQVQEPNHERLLEVFDACSFKTMAEETRKLLLPEPTLSTDREWECVDTDDKLAAFMEQLKRQSEFCLDLETTGLDARKAEIIGWAVSWETNRGYYLPVAGPAGQPTLSADVVLKAFKPLLEDESIEISNQNLKYDMLVVRAAGIEVKGIGVDPMVGDYLLDAGARTHGLDALAARYLSRRMIPISDLIGKGKKQKAMVEVDVAAVAEYASEDADIAWQVCQVIRKYLKDEKLWELYWDLERPLISVLTDMEFQGIRVDVDELQSQSKDLAARLDALEGEIHDLAGREFNIASPKQLAEVLFEDLKLPVLKRMKTGPSTNQDVLERLAVEHDLPAKIIEHRQLAKLKGTYLDALPELVNAETGNIHASFNQVVAATGRLSSSDPNLQNIPIRTPEGSRVRKAFVPSEPGWKLLCADYSQIELRMLAHFSQDAAMQQAFREGTDIHTAVAAEIFDSLPNWITPEQRRVAKAVNFGVIYGQTPWGLSAALRIPKQEAADFINGYFDQYPGVETFMESLLEEVKRTGYAKTILDRRRRIDGVRKTKGRQRNLSERTAINTVIQGSAADLIKQAMIAVHHRLQQERHPARMLMQIHDELVFEVPEKETESLETLVRNEMTSAMNLDVPLVVDINTGNNWLEAK